MSSSDALRALDDKTRRYWAEGLSFGSDLERLSSYIISGLLGNELAHARSRKAIDPPGTQPCEVLVLLVGFSLEPLLQSICVYRPKQILLVLNETYREVNGTDWGDMLAELVEVLLSNSDLPAQPAFMTSPAGLLETARDSPEAVFQFLLRRALPVQRRGERMLIDITGAKKSMVAGAYLFAAYANVPVSYVDFDEYDPVAGRPLGYTCRIGVLENPYESFAIREWQDVERLYRHYSFASAAERLDAIRDAMDGISLKGFFGDSQRQAVAQLREVLEIYELWESGDFHAAHHRRAACFVRGFETPPAVTQLGECWPDPRPSSPRRMYQELMLQFAALEMGPHGELSGSLYLATSLLRAYAHDEFAKIGRILDLRGDYRSGLLRAAGLNETLIKARLISLWHEGELVADGTRRSDLSDADRRLVDTGVVRFSSLPNMVSVLTGDSDQLEVKVRPNRDLEPRRLERTVSARRLHPFWDDRELHPNELAEIRNKAIHSSLTVREPLAREALRVARANLDDFEVHWAGPPPMGGFEKVHTTALEWDDLCTLCGIDFLPHRAEPSAVAETS